jgi:hypothetical protein
LSVLNADKPPLSPDIILNRVAQFAGWISCEGFLSMKDQLIIVIVVVMLIMFLKGTWPIYLTKAPTFVQKIKLFPGAIFIVGYVYNFSNPFFQNEIKILKPF